MEWKSFRFSGEKMETEKNQRFISLDRAIDQNQRLNHVCRVRVSPSSTARPHMVARHAPHRKPSIDNFPACLSMDRAVEY